MVHTLMQTLIQPLNNDGAYPLRRLGRLSLVLATICLAGSGMSACAVVSVASTTVSVAATAVNAGVAVGSAAVSATTTVVKGAVNVGSAVGNAVAGAGSK